MFPHLQTSTRPGGLAGFYQHNGLQPQQQPPQQQPPQQRTGRLGMGHGLANQVLPTLPSSFPGYGYGHDTQAQSQPQSQTPYYQGLPVQVMQQWSGGVSGNDQQQTMAAMLDLQKRLLATRKTNIEIKRRLVEQQQEQQQRAVQDKAAARAVAALHAHRQDSHGVFRNGSGEDDPVIHTKPRHNLQKGSAAPPVPTPRPVPVEPDAAQSAANAGPPRTMEEMVRSAFDHGILSQRLQQLEEQFAEKNKKVESQTQKSSQDPEEGKEGEEENEDDRQEKLQRIQQDREAKRKAEGKPSLTAAQHAAARQEDEKALQLQEEKEKEKAKRTAEEQPHEHVRTRDLKELEDLESDIAKCVEDGNKALGLKVEKTAEELEREGNLASKEETKNRIMSLLSKEDRKRSRGVVRLMPMWRHILNGTLNPPAKRVLKGIPLWRSIVKGIITVYIRPSRAILARKIQFKDKEAYDFKRTLDDFRDPICMWIGRSVKKPLESISVDTKLDFVPSRPTQISEATLSRTKLLELKVRFNAIVKGIINAPMPNDVQTKFLIGLISDQVYFQEGFLYPEELAIVEFDELGGTRGMVRPVAIEDKPMDKPLSKGQYILGEVSKRKVDATRARKVLFNFIVVRVIVGNVCLTPWNYQICRKPGNDSKKRVIHNFRMIASLLYMAAGLCEKDLAPIVPIPINVKQRRADEMLELEADLHRAEDGDGEGADDKQKTDGAKPPQPANPAEKGPGNVVKTKGDEEGKSKDGNASGAEEAHDEATKKPEAVVYEEGTFMAFFFNKPKEEKTGKYDVSSKTAEDYMFDDLFFPQASYITQQTIINFLFTESEFGGVKADLLALAGETSKLLDAFVDKLMLHLLNSRDHTHVEGYDDIHHGIDEEGNELFTSREEDPVAEAAAAAAAMTPRGKHLAFKTAGAVVQSLSPRPPMSARFAPGTLSGKASPGAANVGFGVSPRPGVSNKSVKVPNNSTSASVKVPSLKLGP